MSRRCLPVSGNACAGRPCSTGKGWPKTLRGPTRGQRQPLSRPGVAPDDPPPARLWSGSRRAHQCVSARHRYSRVDPVLRVTMSIESQAPRLRPHPRGAGSARRRRTRVLGIARVHLAAHSVAVVPTLGAAVGKVNLAAKPRPLWLLALNSHGLSATKRPRVGWASMPADNATCRTMAPLSAHMRQAKGTAETGRKRRNVRFLTGRIFFGTKSQRKSFIAGPHPASGNSNSRIACPLMRRKDGLPAH
jgi:hypothetical protein